MPVGPRGGHYTLKNGKKVYGAAGSAGGEGGGEAHLSPNGHPAKLVAQGHAAHPSHEGQVHTPQSMSNSNNANALSRKFAITGDSSLHGPARDAHLAAHKDALQKGDKSTAEQHLKQAKFHDSRDPAKRAASREQEVNHIKKVQQDRAAVHSDPRNLAYAQHKREQLDAGAALGQNGFRQVMGRGRGR